MIYIQAKEILLHKKTRTNWNISHLLKGGAFSWKSSGSLCLNASFDYVVLLNPIQFKTTFAYEWQLLKTILSSTQIFLPV